MYERCVRDAFTVRKLKLLQHTDKTTPPTNDNIALSWSIVTGLTGLISTHGYDISTTFFNVLKIILSSKRYVQKLRHCPFIYHVQLCHNCASHLPGQHDTRKSIDLDRTSVSNALLQNKYNKKLLLYCDNFQNSMFGNSMTLFRLRDISQKLIKNVETIAYFWLNNFLAENNCMKQTFKILCAGGISLYKIRRLIWYKFFFPNITTSSTFLMFYQPIKISVW